METTKYGIIWSQNVHFIKTLLGPLNKNLVVKEYALMKEMGSFGHKMFILSQL